MDWSRALVGVTVAAVVDQGLLESVGLASVQGLGDGREPSLPQPAFRITSGSAGQQRSQTDVHEHDHPYIGMEGCAASYVAVVNAPAPPIDNPSSPLHTTCYREVREPGIARLQQRPASGEH